LYFTGVKLFQEIKISYMDIIEFHQTHLNENTYSNSSLIDSVLFKAKLGTAIGTLKNIELNQSYDYIIKPSDASILISSPYFDKAYKFVINPLGFKLIETTNDREYLTFIDEFWINHQEVIHDVLKFLCENGENGRHYDANLFVSFTNKRFASGTTFDEMLNVVDRIMEMLQQDGAVRKGVVNGVFDISYANETKIRLDGGSYAWPK
jgi:hypothetical protein